MLRPRPNVRGSRPTRPRNCVLASCLATTPRLLAVLVSSAVLLTACMQPSAGPGPGAGPVGAPQRGGEFRINLQSEPDTIDPNRANFAQSITVAIQVFEGLLGYDKDLKLIPAAAKEVPSISNGGISSDGLTYTFKLRPEAKWSDGQPVKAKDFVYAMKRSLEPKLAAPYASNLHDIQGAKEYNSAKDAFSEQLASLREKVAVTAPDDTTLVVKLNAARPSFLHLASLWVAWPVRQDIVERHGDKWAEPPNYIGNGPWVLTRWAHNERLEFAPNPHYWGQKPYLDKLTMLLITDLNQGYLAYQNGELDATAIPEPNTKLVLADPKLSQETFRNKELTTFGFQFNNKEAPFDNVKVRQALALAVDRKALIEHVAQGIGTVAYSPIAPGMPGHDPNLGKEVDFNVEKAKKLLSEAGYADGSRFPRIQFTFSDTSANRLRAEFFQGQMKQNLGIDMALEPLDARAYSQRFNANQFTMVFGGWGMDYPDPDNFVPELFRTGSGNNHTQYSNTQVDALSRQCQSELDETKRMVACMDAQKQVVADQPWIFAFYRERFWLLNPKVQGFQLTAKDSLPGYRFYHHIWLAK